MMFVGTLLPVNSQEIMHKPNVMPLLTELFNNLDLDYLALQDVQLFDLLTYDILSCVNNPSMFTSLDFFDLKIVLTNHNSLITSYLGSDCIQHELMDSYLSSDWIQHELMDVLLGNLTEHDLQECVELYVAAQELNADIATYFAKREVLVG